MTAEEFYDTFKEILDFLGVGWGGKDRVEVSGELKFRCEDKEVTIKPRDSAEQGSKECN